MPLTTGCLLQEPKVVKFPEVSLYTANEDGVLNYNPFVKSSIVDVFKKLDITGDGVLSAFELNQFGHIANLRFFKNIQQEDFNSKKMKKYSSTSAGLTMMGFMQLLLK